MSHFSSCPLCQYVGEELNDVFISCTDWRYTHFLSLVYAISLNDSFVVDQAFFVNGEDASHNVATLPGGFAVGANSVNCNIPFDPPTPNPFFGLFILNEVSSRLR
jgi:hypothetical protein